MSTVLDKLESVLTPFALKLNENRYLNAIKDGLIGAMAFIIVGSIFLLLANLPINGYPEFMASIFGQDWQSFFTVPYDMTMNIMTVYIIIGIGRSLSVHYQLDGLTGILGSVAAFLILTPIVDASGSKAIPLANLSSSGLFLGMISAIIAVEIYRLVVKRGWVITMPSSVPANVTASFASLIPILFIMVIFGVIRVLIAMTDYGTAQNFIFDILQQPLTSLGATLPAMIIGILFETVLWSIGIHGSSLHRSVMEPIWHTLTAGNLAAIEAGLEPTNIINFQFYSNYIKLGGVGATFGLLICCLFFAKSEQLKSIGKLSLAPSLFNINEPIMFGLPIVLNPILIIPFILTPTVITVLTYFVTNIGLLPAANGLNIPWTTPPVIAGFLIGGWRGAVWQVICIVMSVGIYYPFFRIHDNNLVKEEA